MKNLYVLLALCASGCASQAEIQAQYDAKVQELRAAHIAKLEAAQSITVFDEFQKEQERRPLAYGSPDPVYDSYRGINVADMRRKWYCRTHPDLPTQTSDAILRGQLLIGMTGDDVWASWGRPDRINQSTIATGTRQQWVYSDTLYAYIEGGALTAWTARSL